MNTELQAQLDRVEAALNTLVDSITSYNPSPTAALSLAAADDDFNKGLDRLQTHQANHTTLVHLRATSAALDARIRSNLSALADTRKQLLVQTPVTTAPADARPLSYTELLSYAQRIAKSTRPPTYRPPLPPPIGDATATTEAPLALTAQETKQEPDTPQPPQTTSTPGVPSAHATPSAPPQDPPTARALAALPPEIAAWLDPRSSALPFTPWPGEDIIRRGALAQIQGLRDRGGDPATEDLVTGASGVADRAAQAAEEEEERRREDEAKAQAQAQDRVREVKGRAGEGGARSRAAERTAVFEGFELYNPDEA